MENKPTELPEQTIPELALVMANNPGVREVQIVDASNHVAIVAPSLLKLRSDQGGFVYMGGLIVKAPKKQKQFKYIEENRVHLGLDELDATEYGSRYLVAYNTSSEGMSKKGCIQQMRDAFERAQSNMSATTACTPPLLAGVCGVGVCAWAWVSAAPRHSWSGCWGVCVLVCVLLLYPATPGWG